LPGEAETGAEDLPILVEARTKRVMFGLWCLTWLMVLVVSLRPVPELAASLSDKWLHFLTYAVMTAAVAGFCHRPAGVLRWAGFALLMGGLVELGQHFTPSRSMELGDFLADLGGVACGLLLAALWLARVIQPLRRAAAT
jgi:VanZ family protein